MDQENKKNDKLDLEITDLSEEGQVNNQAAGNSGTSGPGCGGPSTSSDASVHTD